MDDLYRDAGAFGLAGYRVPGGVKCWFHWRHGGMDLRRLRTREPFAVERGERSHKAKAPTLVEVLASQEELCISLGVP
jgi:hypothetical protein